MYTRTYAHNTVVNIVCLEGAFQSVRLCVKPVRQTLSPQVRCIAIHLQRIEQNIPAKLSVKVCQFSSAGSLCYHMPGYSTSVKNTDCINSPCADLI